MSNDDVIRGARRALCLMRLFKYELRGICRDHGWKVGGPKEGLVLRIIDMELAENILVELPVR